MDDAGAPPDVRCLSGSGHGLDCAARSRRAGARFLVARRRDSRTEDVLPAVASLQQLPSRAGPVRACGIRERSIDVTLINHRPYVGSGFSRTAQAPGT
jgi:hypothetical protein